MSMENTYEKLQKLMNSYVPEFAYRKDGRDPGSVLSDLCAGMIDESAKNYEKVIPKHQIQYLNMFDSMIKEPVSAARGYVQFEPVSGYTDMVPIPAKTRVMAEGEEGAEYIFETEHDLVARDTMPELIAVTDRKSDKIVVYPYVHEEHTAFQAFDVEGENQAEHRLYLGFDQLFDHLNRLELYIYAEAFSENDQQELLECLSGDDICWSVLDPQTGAHEFSVKEIKDGAIYLCLEDYIPQKVLIGQKEAYFITASCSDNLPKLYMKSLKIGFERKEIIPEAVYINGVSEIAGGIYPFGKPFGLYNEFSFDDREVLARKGANIKLNFQLSYRLHEEDLELPEFDTEYKAIMKKPKKPLSMRSAEVMADYVLWEYLSTTGWKRLFKEEHINALFNGTTEGAVSLEFVCPEDIAEFTEGEGTGRIRARLLRAENIYQIPAVYKCPFISGIQLSYSYGNSCQAADYAYTKNNFYEKDVTEDFRKGGNVTPFYQTEHSNRAMYLGFSESIEGSPFSLYFDIESQVERPIKFHVEYLSEKGFTPAKVIDYTGAFTGSGNMLLLIPKDAVKGKLFGYEGYFLRFINENQENPHFALPLIKGIYPNMARVVNVNTITEEFYLSDLDNAVDIQLNQQNLIDLKVWAAEKDFDSFSWIPWKMAERSYEEGRCYSADMAEGIIRFRKYAFSEYDLVDDGPQIKVEHANYTGSKANLPAGAIQTLGTSIRYISSVNNPFPTYGGYDGYTEETSMDYVAGMLRTRNRAVTNRDFHELIKQTVYGVRKVKCCNHRDAYGNKAPGNVTIAILTEEYEKGSHVFYEMKRKIADRLTKDSALYPLGRKVSLVQPYFVKLNVRVWLEKESLENAYDLQNRAKEMIEKFIDPLHGGPGYQGWEIGEFPRSSQIIATLRTGISGCSISKILMTAQIEGKEVPVDESFFEKVQNPLIMAVNGEHIVYIEVSEC